MKKGFAGTRLQTLSHIGWSVRESGAGLRLLIEKAATLASITRNVP